MKQWGKIKIEDNDLVLLIINGKNTHEMLKYFELHKQESKEICRISILNKIQDYGCIR